LRDLQNDLSQTFGTKKAKKAIASFAKNVITPSNLPQASDGAQTQKLSAVDSAILASMAEGVKGVATREELQFAADEGKPRHKANLDAATVKAVYPIEDIIGVDILKVLRVKDWRDKAREKKEVITKSRFVAQRVQRHSEDVEKLKALRYLSCLLGFYSAFNPRGRNVRGMSNKVEVRKAFVGTDPAVLENISERFSTAGQISKFQSDLLITTTCILALIVDDFRVDFHDLREDLNLEAKDMAMYFREVGARMVAPSEKERVALGLDKAATVQRKFAKLQLPLDFPKLKFARRG